MLAPLNQQNEDFPEIDDKTGLFCGPFPFFHPSHGQNAA
jgi:hypothetical protein